MYGRDGRLHAGIREEGRLDLAELDAEAADLDLLILTPEKLDRAVRTIPSEVSGVVEALPRLRMTDEAGVCLLGIAPVVAGKADPADEQLAAGVNRALREIRLEHVERLVSQRRAVGDACPLRVDAIDREEDRPDRGFGCAAKAVDRRARARRPQPVGQRDRYPVAAHHHETKAAKERERIGPVSASSASAGTESQIVTP